MLLEVVSHHSCLSTLCPLLAQVPSRMLPSPGPRALLPFHSLMFFLSSPSLHAVGAITGGEPIAGGENGFAKHVSH